MPRPLVIAHRGDPFHSLENSLASIRSAMDLSVDMVEIDVRKSRDHGLFIMHDAMTGRTCEQNVHIERRTSQELAGIRLKNGESIPLLQDVLDLVQGRCGLNLEIKSDGAGALTAQLLRSSMYKWPVLVSSFKEDELVGARRIIPDLLLAKIFDVFTTRQVSSYVRRGYTVVSLNKRTVNEKLLAACRDKGLRVYVWTVDDELEMTKFLFWGVDGMYSNRPGMLRHVLEQHLT